MSDVVSRGELIRAWHRAQQAEQLLADTQTRVVADPAVQVYEEALYRIGTACVITGVGVRCTQFGSGRTRDAVEPSMRWCDHCVVHDALDRVRGSNREVWSPMAVVA